MDAPLIHFLRQLYGNSNARVRYGVKGECTAPFNVEKGVRPGCVLAPFVFTLYTNGLEHTMAEKGLDVPQINNHPLHALLYADDAVLMARTQLGLQRACTVYTEYMDNLGLKVNTTKTFIMKCGKGSAKCLLVTERWNSPRHFSN